MAQAITGSIALEQLKSDLTMLASNLREMHGTLISQMTTLGDSWQDSQYQQFVEGYKPQIEKCAEIADRYDYGCKKILDPQIENVRAIEQTDLSGGGFTSGASPVGSGDTSTAPSSSRLADVFNLNAEAPRNSTDNIRPAIDKGWNL